MKYRIEFTTEAEKDLEKLDRSIQIKVLKIIKKLSKNPTAGYPLGNKAGIDLSGYYKTYVFKKKIRIVYKILKEKLIVTIIAVGKRSNFKVYIEAGKRRKS